MSPRSELYSMERPAVAGRAQLLLRRRVRIAIFGLALPALVGVVSARAQGLPTQPFDPALARYVDLTHPFDAQTVYLGQSGVGFTFSMLTSGRKPEGYFFAEGAFQAPEHGGTHVDAPLHYQDGGRTVDRIGLEHLVAPLVVLDVSFLVQGSPDYEVSASDIAIHESRYGPIPKGSVVVARTGWSSRWGDRAAYLGADDAGEGVVLHFPGFGEEAMRMLVEQRGVAAVGIDTASLDPGRSAEFRAHRLAASRDVPGFENLTDLDKVPARGAWMLALPMKIEGGTGAPLRAVAMVPLGR